MPQSDKKKGGKKTGKSCLMSINSNNSRKMEANFFDQDAFFTFLFYLINSYLPGIGICGNN